MAETIEALIRRIVFRENGGASAADCAHADHVLHGAEADVERAMDEVRTEIGRLRASRDEMQRAAEHVRATIADLAENIALALEHGREDEAEAAITKQSDLENQLPILEVSLRTTAAKLVELDSYLAALSLCRRDMVSASDQPVAEMHFADHHPTRTPAFPAQ